MRDEQKNSYAHQPSIVGTVRIYAFNFLPSLTFLINLLNMKQRLATSPEGICSARGRTTYSGINQKKAYPADSLYESLVALPTLFS